MRCVLRSQISQGRGDSALARFGGKCGREGRERKGKKGLPFPKTNSGHAYAEIELSIYAYFQSERTKLMQRGPI